MTMYLIKSLGWCSVVICMPITYANKIININTTKPLFSILFLFYSIINNSYIRYKCFSFVFFFFVYEYFSAVYWANIIILIIIIYS